MDVHRLVRAWEDTSLPRERWTHAAHLTVATVLLVRHPADLALVEARVGIQRYNAAHGIVQTPTGGYHETLTCFYMWAVGEALRRGDRTRPLHQLANQVVATLSDREVPLRYYSRERLMSIEARLTWIEPDIRPLTDLDGS